MRVTDQATRVVSAGWYQDPASSVQVRWWNGIAWTEHVREKPTTSPTTMGQSAIAQGGLAGEAHESSVAEAAETHEERLAAVRDLEHQFGIGAVENPFVGAGSFGATPTATATAMTTTANAASNT